MVKALILCIALTGCATIAPPVSDPRGVWCENNEPWRLPAVAVVMLNRAELDALNTHNSRGEEWCGWKP